ncbi:MAG TPA: lysozyme inhibitor LprI family protein [Terracidiphilus sp.]|jgi:uncharacterized protein YecT (DUF1311 family)|nr:lysozyme inhibitor LprI family protein [Terracidiphilus sp.]
MSRLLILLLLATTPLLAQTPKTSTRHKASVPVTDDGKWVDSIGTLQNRAGDILKAELSRKPDPACDNDQLSMAEEGQCLSADETITERNYRAFAQALKASLEIQPPELDRKIFPPASKNFAAAEAAWLKYVDKTCAALGDTYDGGSGTPMAMTRCQQQLTQQHMKDLNTIFLKAFETHK